MKSYLILLRQLSKQYCTGMYEERINLHVELKPIDKDLSEIHTSGWITYYNQK
jgi:hypothetical protein